MSRPVLPPTAFAAAVVLTLAAVATAVPASAQQPARPAAGAAQGQPAAADVAWAKETLRLLGFDAGRADATVTELFTRRVREFQLARGMPATGRLDEATTARLMQERPTRQGVNQLSLNPVVTGEAPSAAPPPPPVPAAPRAAPQVGVQADPSTAQSTALAVISRPGAIASPPAPAPAQTQAPPPSPATTAPRAAAPQAPVQTLPSSPPTSAASAAGPRPSTTVALGAANEPVRPQDLAERARLDGVLTPTPQAGAPQTGAAAAVQVGPRAEGVLTREGEVTGRSGPPAWVAWIGLVLLVATAGLFGVRWWQSGERDPVRFGVAPKDDMPRVRRRAPSLAHVANALGAAAEPRIGPTFAAVGAPAASARGPVGMGLTAGR